MKTKFDYRDENSDNKLTYNNNSNNNNSNNNNINNNNNNKNNNNNNSSDSSVGRLLCVCLVKRFTVRISPLAFFADAPYMCGSQKRSGKIILGVLQPS